MAWLADELEFVQLGMAGALLRRVEAVVGQGPCVQGELAGVVPLLCAALRDVLRVAESRGARLPVGAGVGVVVERPGLVVRRWPAEARYVGAARRLLWARLEAWGMAQLADTAVLVLSELHGNAVRHARCPEEGLIETRFERLPDGTLRIEVHDADGTRPEPLEASLEASADAESGRGLGLVDALTGGRWGVSDREGIGKAVWAECTGAGVTDVCR